ncbi:hypothetical protein [Stutzerimonas stutzeri]|uniref:Uncharacterized protein n=1 Tax=Stutzerimonas stutzeri KOS6 TaxID=1218352 RepID=A0A061JMZ2_STUST|nr:hypothetical protein [Stutzerimonas stutzeri]EWC39559.1 hypothetical protein B597_019405 [Stutzerimonas stutzeri KOS6]
MKQQPPWIHRAGDGRGVRKVFLDGEEIKMAVFADQKRGIVDRYRQPLKIHSRDERLITERLHGRVEVVWQTSS